MTGGSPVCGEAGTQPSVLPLCLCWLPENSLAAEGKVGAVLWKGTRISWMASSLEHQPLLPLLHAGAGTGSGFGAAGDPRPGGTPDPDPLTHTAHGGMSVERKDPAVCCAHVALMETILVLNPLARLLRKGPL